MVWSTLGGPTDTTNFFSDPLNNWIRSNLTVIDEKGMSIWETLFGITLWWIWRWRNCFTFGKGEEIPTEIGAFIKGPL